MLWRLHIVQKLYIFHYEGIPPNLTCCNILKVDIKISENPLQKLRIFTFWHFLCVCVCVCGGGGGGGVALAKKSK